MNRSGYSDDGEDDPLEHGRWRAQVASAIRGKRGQAFLRELAAAMDAMPVKELIDGELVNANGACCTLGVVCQARGLDVTEWNIHDADRIARALGIAGQLVCEIEGENDEFYETNLYFGLGETPEMRWHRMRAWVEQRIKKPKEGGT